MLREQLQALWEADYGAHVAPTPAQASQLRMLAAWQSKTRGDYDALFKSDVASLNAALASAGLKPIPTLSPGVR